MRWLVLIYGVVAYLLGIRSLVYFAAFASNVPLVRTVDSGPVVAWPEAIAVDLALLLAFAASHSLLARDGFKRVFARLLPEAALRSTYVLVSAVSLSLLMWQWRPIETVVWEVSSATGRHALVGLAVAGWALAAISYYTIGHLELLGLRQTHRWFRGKPQKPGDLVTTGIYRYLRDPMYLGFAIGMWSTPRMTLGHLVLSAGMTLYLLIGARYERRDLTARFGDRYREHLQRNRWKPVTGYSFRGSRRPSK